jgi:hypothetical protein
VYNKLTHQLDEKKNLTGEHLGFEMAFSVYAYRFWEGSDYVTNLDPTIFELKI